MSEIYDGYSIVDKMIATALRPDPTMLVSEWADKYRMLQNESSKEPGQWRTKRTPYLKEIMDNLSKHNPTEKVVFMKGAQIGGTEAGNNWIGYVIHLVPGPMLCVSPTVEGAKKNSKQRIEPFINQSPILRRLVASAKSRDSDNTILNKKFAGGRLFFTGANSASGLRSMPIRYLFMDEIDAYPPDVDTEGDPVLLAERRTATFSNRKKIFLVSTPTIKGLSRIAIEFEDSTKKYYFVPCPFCKHMQKIEFERLNWTPGKTDVVKFQCKKCNKLIGEHEKTYMLTNGEWRAENPGNKNQGFHLSSLYSPAGWFSWSEIAKIYELAKKNPSLMKAFVNTILGEPFEEEFDAPDFSDLMLNRLDYIRGTVPKQVVFLTAGVDIQRDRIECEIVGWGRNKESWSIDYYVIAGDTAATAVWDKLELILNKEYEYEDQDDICDDEKRSLPIRVMCVDSGFATQDVYSWVRKFPQAIYGAGGARAPQPRTVVAIKGQDRGNSIIHSVRVLDGKKSYGLKLWNIAIYIVKVELYRWLKLERPTQEELKQGIVYPRGFCHFPYYEEEYFKQLTSEKRVVKIIKGYPRAIWEKDRATRNEALDCRVYARGAAYIFGLDRFTEYQWNLLEKDQQKSIVKRKYVRKKINQDKNNSFTAMIQKKEAVYCDNPFL